MPKLKPLPATELSAYVVDLLSKHDIKTVYDFLTTDIIEISKKSNLSTNCVQQLRLKLREIYSPKRINVLEYYNNYKIHHKTYGFGIKSLDDLLGPNGFGNTSFIEIYGEGAIGKTLLCHTVLLNIIQSHKIEALYIDTKEDFSASGLYGMMRERNVDKSECSQIMQRIKVERIMSLKGVLKALIDFEDLLKTGSRLVTNIKVIVIDAISALWFTLNGEEERLERQYLLSKIANILHKFAKEYFIAILLVNLAVQDEELFAKNAELNLSSTTEVRQQTFGLNLKPTLGRYWISVPFVRLLLSKTENAEDSTVEHFIEVTKNNYGPTGNNCKVRLTNEGVVS